MRKYLMVLYAVSLSGCAQYWWVKNGISQQEANQDNYACLQEAQQRVAGAQVNPYGGAAQNTVITNRDLYNACMAARGYTYQRKQ